MVGWQPPYTKPSDTPSAFVNQTCAAANKNLVPFYTKWKVPMSTAVQNYCGSLPAWSYDPALSP